jgi:hypothetical protein
MFEIVRKRPEQFDLAPLHIETRAQTAHFVSPVAKGNEYKIICNDPSATVKRRLSYCRNPGLANHVRGPKESFNDLDLRIGNRLWVFIRPRFCGMIDSRRSCLNGSPQYIQHLGVHVIFNFVVEKTQQNLHCVAGPIFEHGAISQVGWTRWEI